MKVMLNYPMYAGEIDSFEIELLMPLPRVDEKFHMHTSLLPAEWLAMIRDEVQEKIDDNPHVEGTFESYETMHKSVYELLVIGVHYVFTPKGQSVEIDLEWMEL